MLPITLLERRVGTAPATFLLLALMSIAGCSDGPLMTESGTPATSSALFISGGMTPQKQFIRVVRDGAPVTNASVTVNGFPIPYCCGDLYSGALPEPVAAGGTLNLKVVAGALSFEAAGEVAPTPTITAPVAGSTFASTDAVKLAWSTPTDPDRFEVCVNCWENSLDGAMYQASGSTREFKIAPGALVDYGTGAVVALYAFKSNFLKPGNSPRVTTDIHFVARSRDALITIKY